MKTLTEFDTLGERLQLLLDGTEYNQKQVQEKLSLKDNSISNCIHGRTPGAETLYKLSDFFEVSMEWLLTGEDKTKYIRDEEIQLIQTYRTLNEEQQEKASCYLVGITTPLHGLNNRLRLLIKNAGYKHEDVTAGAKISKNIISKYLKGGIPDPKVLYKLSKFFQVSMEWFVEGEVIIASFSKEENQFIQNYRMLNLKEQREIIGYMNGIREGLGMNEEVRRACLSREEELKEIVIKMLQQNVSDDIIKSVIEISEDALEEIKKELNS